MVFFGVEMRENKWVFFSMLISRIKDNRFFLISVALHAVLFFVILHHAEPKSRVVAGGASVIQVRAVALTQSLSKVQSPTTAKTNKRVTARASNAVSSMAKATLKVQATRQIREHKQAQLKAQAKKKVQAVRQARELKQAQLKAKAKQKAQVARELRKKKILLMQQKKLEDKEKAISNLLMHQQQQSEVRRIAAIDAAQKKRLDQAELEKYIALIQHKVRLLWRWPLDSDKIACRIAVMLASDGTVTKVSLISSSGNQAFDNSALQAVRRASPLPIPKNNALYIRSFRQLNLKMSPRDPSLKSA